MNWYWPPSYHTYLARKLKRFILVGFPLFHTAESWCRQAIYDRMLNQCDAVVTITKYEADFVRERAAVRVEVAGGGIRPDAFAPRDGNEIRRRYRLGLSPVVGFVGRQIYSKGVTRLIAAMRLVWEWNPAVRIILAGPCPKRPDNLDLLIRSLPEHEREQIVRIDGFSDGDKPSLFDAFDVFVLPSTEESFGIAYLEAWVCGKPVIGARIGSTQCVIDEGVDGLLVDPNDPHDLALKIIELLSNPDERMRLGRNGRKKAETHYTWANVTEVFEGLYVDLLRTKSSTS
jgi:glycosyltransferase involved in cell wall biosynthesis